MTRSTKLRVMVREIEPWQTNVILRLKAEESLFKDAASCGELTRRDQRGNSLNKLCIFVGVIIGGYLGWWIGDQVGSIMTAFLISPVGSLVGVYLGWRINRDYLS